MSAECRVKGKRFNTEHTERTEGTEGTEKKGISVTPHPLALSPTRGEGVLVAGVCEERVIRRG
jgi:hypothetical protein